MSGRVIACAILLCLAGETRGTEKVWGALVYATPRVEEAREEPGLEPFRKELSQVFGYRHFRILGDQTKDIEAVGERWVIPGRGFSVLLQPKKAGRNGVEFHIELFQERKLLVATDARVLRDHPLFIRGPLYANGQLVIVLAIKD